MESSCSLYREHRVCIVCPSFQSTNTKHDPTPFKTRPNALSRCLQRAKKTRASSKHTARRRTVTKRTMRNRRQKDIRPQPAAPTTHDTHSRARQCARQCVPCACRVRRMTTTLGIAGNHLSNLIFVILGDHGEPTKAAAEATAKRLRHDSLGKCTSSPNIHSVPMRFQF